jgi:membrane-associated phospholipid phosphatase
MAYEPWFVDWNYHVMEVLFHHIPHRAITDGSFDFLISTPLLSTWIIAAFFYRFWTKDDDQKNWRRGYLLTSVTAFALAVTITVVIRPWIHWPAPALNPTFQALFPEDLRGEGSKNCFPSHSTLTYFTMAAGFWPLHRRLSAGLSVLVLLLVSLPRVYVGGHYPIDVLFSCVLGVLALVAMWRWPLPATWSNWLVKSESTTNIRDWVFFLWVFELGEQFRSLELLAGAARRLSRL